MREALTPLRFLSIATVGSLELRDDPMPWAVVAALQGIMGEFLTENSRVDEMSNVQTFAALFRRYHSECATDGALARALRFVLSDIRLPLSMEPHSVDSEELFTAAVDGFNYHDATRREHIEERRVRLILDDVSLPLLSSYTCTGIGKQSTCL